MIEVDQTEALRILRDARTYFAQTVAAQPPMEEGSEEYTTEHQLLWRIDAFLKADPKPT